MRGTLKLLLACLAIPCLQLAAFNGGNVASRQPWMDEIHSLEIVRDPSLSHAMQALEDGADYNPPAYYLLARVFQTVTGSHSPAGLRLLSLGCVLLGLIGVVLTLQRRFSDEVCLTVALALWAQSVLLDQVLEARFYAPWFCTLAWYCWCMGGDRISSLRVALGCGLATIITTTHYFGIVTIGLFTLGQFPWKSGRQRWSCSFWMPPSFGCCGLAICLSLFYSGQRAALTESTWVSTPTFDSLRSFAVATVPWDALLLCGVGWIGGRMVNDSAEDSESDPANAFHPLREYGGMLCLSGLFMVLMVFSVLVQPAQIPRYAMVGLIGFAPLLAWFCTELKRPVLVLICLVLLLLGTQRWRQISGQLLRLDASREALLVDIEEHAGSAHVVFENRIDSFPQTWIEPWEGNNRALIDFETDELVESSKLRVVQRDVGRKFAKWYPRYRMQSVESLRSLPRFFVVPYAGRETNDVKYGNFQARKVADRLFEMIPIAPSSPKAEN